MIYIKTSKANRKQLLTILIITAILGIVFMFLGFRDKKTEKYYCIENSNIDYKVYLKPNNFFDATYLEKNKTYITSLIDHINTDFYYSAEFNKRVSGDLTYQLKAEIQANKENSDITNYWTKEYILTDPVTESLDKEFSFSLSSSQNIDYNNYNEILESFIKEYGLTADSILKVYLNVKGNLDIENSKKKLEVNTNVTLKMPLSKLAIEGTIDTDSKDSKIEVEESSGNKFLSFVFKILFFIDIVILCKYIFEYIECVKLSKKNISYRKKVKMISDEYEGIITNVKEINLSNYSIFPVMEFDDLLNVYNNIREPINCKYDYEETIYFIINDKCCYTYTLTKDK